MEQQGIRPIPVAEAKCPCFVREFIGNRKIIVTSRPAERQISMSVMGDLTPIDYPSSADGPALLMCA